MTKELLIERMLSQMRLAVLEDGRLCELYTGRGEREKLTGGIYVGRVQNILPGMNAAFVDIGLGKNAYLSAGDIGLDLRGEPGLAGQLKEKRIEKMLHSGDMITCQVIREPGGTKGPRISQSVTLPGRLMVLLPNLQYAGVSRKIADSAERDRLYEIAQRITQETGHGIIVRTAGRGTDEEEITREAASLIERWEDIRRQSASSQKPRKLESDGDLIRFAVRELLGASVERIATDDAEVFKELKSVIAELAPSLASKAQLLPSEMPLFDLKRVDHQLEEAFRRHVNLRSGGNIVVDETEAMTVIDVNTAKFTGKSQPEDNLFQLNCEAAEEIARQLRLRDIGGIIIIDFIDMPRPEQRQALMEHLRSALTADRNRTNVVGMTPLGFVEMTRKKANRALNRQMMHECPLCHGTGRVMTPESTAYRAAREIWRRRRMGDTTGYALRISRAAAEELAKAGLDQWQNIEINPNGPEGSFSLEPVEGINR